MGLVDGQFDPGQGLLAAGEPLGALIGGSLIAAGFLRMDRRLAFAGGAMVYVSLTEIFTKAQNAFSEAYGQSMGMAAATLAIGSAMTNADIGLTAWLSGAIEPVLTGLNPVLIVLVRRKRGGAA